MILEEMQRIHAEADGLIRGMYAGRVGWTARERVLDRKLGAVFATARCDTGISTALHRLVYDLKDRSRLVAIEPVLGTLGPQAGNTGLDALLHFARCHETWQQEPESWMPDADDARGQVGSLARHLFARYPLPGFLDAVWLSGFSEAAEAQREWFVHLGRGGKLEAIRFPMPMTHLAAHHFLLAPEAFTVAAAMRYGQIRALDGSEALAHAVAETFLSELQSFDEPFWLSVIHFFVNHPELPLSQIGPVADYVRFCRFGSGGQDAAGFTRGLTGVGCREATGAYPRSSRSFTMKGRTVDALLRQMDEWHETLARASPGHQKTRQSWGPNGLESLDKIEKDRFSAATCHWRIVEITDSLSLLEEGRAMRHCVRSYQAACVKGETSIWSLRMTLSDNPTPVRLLTIQVNNQRRSVVQVRGKCNQSLSALRGRPRLMRARELLRDWARKQRLGIHCGL